MDIDFPELEAPELDNSHVHTVSVVIPVFSGHASLIALIDELEIMSTCQVSPRGHRYQIAECLLVWDGGISEGQETVRTLAKEKPWVRVVWLSRNFGQHAATLAGMSSSGSQWVITMDDDGQHNPAFIGVLLDVAFDSHAQLVYASPTGARPHSITRNVSSGVSRWLFRRISGDTPIQDFHSFRLISGEVARSTAAYTGTGVYLDVALSWVVSKVATCPIPMRTNQGRRSGYKLSGLVSHFTKLVISSGTKPLLLVSIMGALFFTVGILYSLWIFVNLMSGAATPEGWTSSFIATLLVGGLILFSLGVIAQYMRVTVDMSLGKPLYVVTRDPDRNFIE